MGLSLHEQQQNAKLLTLDELVELNAFVVGRIKHQRSIAGQRMKQQLSVGSTVSFMNNDNQLVEGNVIKIMRKYAQIHVNGSIWRVPLNLLTKV